MIKEFKLGKKVIKIKYVQKIPGERKSTLGVFDPGERTIYIRNQDKDEMIYTLLHEMMHAVLWNRSLHNLVKPNVEEIICDVFADTLVDIVQNNDLRYIIKGVNKNGKNK